MTSVSPTHEEPQLPPHRRAANAPKTGPTFSVVVASNRDLELLDACLKSLVGQCAKVGAELIVARAGLHREGAALTKRFPAVRFIGAPDDASIPLLRGMGMGEATGDIVALTEDHCIADPEWLETLAAHAPDDVDVIGGGMDNAQRDRAVDWGAYFAEYGFFAPTRKSDEHQAPLLTGANVAYRRRVVDEVIALAQRDEWENVAHARLLARGSILQFVSSATISQNKHYDFVPFVVDRYQHGRDYARKRLAEEGSGGKRWLLLAGSPALPFLLTWRVASAAGRTRAGAFLRALPATFAFLTAWAVGEAAGYLKGPSAETEQKK
jgi:GT2 family glycosyltransferase